MMKVKLKLVCTVSITLIVVIAAIGCKKDKAKDGDWLIPENEVLSGGPGKDGIPSIDDPKFYDPGNASYVSDEELVVVVKVGTEVRAYPHGILDWHEIINDEIGNSQFAIVYCPLTGTATWWNRIIFGTATTFGVSGLLYNSNIIPYDRATGSNWSQIRLDCVNGDLIGSKAQIGRIVETKWKSALAAYPNLKVIDEENTGYSRNYNNYPYGSYRTNNDYILFDVSNDDTRLPRKERVLGVIAGTMQKVFQFSSFKDSTRLVDEIFNGTHIVCVGNQVENYMVAFSGDAVDGTSLTFTPLSNSLPDVMTDNEGNTWDIFGNATAGPRMGEQLPIVTSFMGYWFAWATFYPDITIH